MQLLQSYGCIYVPSMMIVAAIVYKVQTQTFSYMQFLTLVYLIADAKEDTNAAADTNTSTYWDYDTWGIA